MKKSIICWIALAGFTVSAQAADLGDSLKDPLPQTLTYKGITLFGSIDVGYAYATTGAPVGGSYWGINPQVFGAPAGYEHVSTLNTMALSYIGLKVDEDLGSGWRAVGKLMTSFDPLTGEIDDMCKVRIANNGVAPTQRTVNGNGTKCGQAVNGDAYAGVSNATYGTLTVGRQTSLAYEVAGQYDPQAYIWYGSAYQFLSPGTTGFATRWDNSVKYSNSFGPFHAAVMWAQGGEDTGLFANSYAGDVGVTWRGFSVDATYMLLRDAITDSTFGVAACGGTGQSSCSTLKATNQNIESWQILGKYTYDLSGGYKDMGPGGKLTFYVGYDHATASNPSSFVAAGLPTVGGYILGGSGGQVNNTPYSFGDSVTSMVWVGASYQTGPWTFAAAYYRYYQDFFKTSATSTSCSSSASFNCSGADDTASLSAVYSVNKHLDLYGEVVWSGLSGGLANGYSPAEQTTIVTGLVLKF